MSGDSTSLPPEIELRAVDRETAEAIVAGEHRPGWAADYPDRGGQIAARMLLRGLDAGIELGGFGMFQIVADGAVVGNIGFHGLPAEGSAEIGFDLAASCRGRGYARTALRQLSAWALAQPEVTQVVARTDDQNVASQRVITGAGFTERPRAGEMRRYTLE